MKNQTRLLAQKIKEKNVTVKKVPRQLVDFDYQCFREQVWLSGSLLQARQHLKWIIAMAILYNNPKQAPAHPQYPKHLEGFAGKNVNKIDIKKIEFANSYIKYKYHGLTLVCEACVKYLK